MLKHRVQTAATHMTFLQATSPSTRPRASASGAAPTNTSAFPLQTWPSAFAVFVPACETSNLTLCDVSPQISSLSLFPVTWTLFPSVLGCSAGLSVTSSSPEVTSRIPVL